MKKKLLVMAALVIIVSFAKAQFEGSYVMKIDEEGAKAGQPVEMKFVVKGNMATMEMLNMNNKGYGKTIINSKEKTMTTLVESGANKMAMKTGMQGFNPSAAEKPKITETGKTKVIEGYKCKEIIVESADNTSDMWTTTELGLSMTDVLGFAGSGRATNLERFYADKGVSLETTITNKKDNKKTTMYIKDIKKSPVSTSEFSIEGYKLMEAPAMNR